MQKIYLSTVTPVYRGELYLRELVQSLAEVRGELLSHRAPVELVECIFVDDAAVDDSVDVLLALQQTHPWISVVQLSRNFGQHAATVAGVLHSSGDWVATLDEDLQHDPRHLLPMLLHAARNGLDVVYASSDQAVHRSMFRNLSSRLYKRTVSWLAGNSAIRRFSSFRMTRGSVMRAACAVSTHDTYLDVVVSWFTGRIGSLQVPLVDVRSSTTVPSGYSLNKLLLHARRMLISSEIKPLRIASVVGILALFSSLILAVGTIALKMLRPETIALQGWASLIFAISFFGGLTALLLGVAIEYLSTVALHTLGKPNFFVVDRSKDALLLPFADETGAR